MEFIIYVRDNCFESGKALDIASWVKKLNPDINLRVVNLDRDESDFKMGYQGPVYVFNGKIIRLGNPNNERLMEFVENFEKEHLN